jgi:tRNA (guanine37-N1)-methyltransferase
MVLRPEPVFDALDAIIPMDPRPPFVVLTTPQGERFTQACAARLAGMERLVLVCGHYEGFDERIRTCVDLELSIGDYVLTGGELAAMVVTDAVTRLLPGVLGDEASCADESHTTGLLEYPHYTRPAVYRGMEVPEVLRSGDHAKIALWRARQATERTARRRPDLLAGAWPGLTDDQRAAARAALETDTEEA